MSKLRHIVILAAYLLGAASSGCSRQRPALDNAPRSASAEEVVARATPAPLYREEEPAWTKGPWFSKDAGQLKVLKEAWRKFTAGGRYRLARKEEMRFPAEVRRAMGADEHELYKPFAFVWGGMSYPRMEGRDHLVAIVSDALGTDEERLGLVVFSAPKDGGGRYEAHLVSHDADLSRAWISHGGGDLSLTEYPSGGGQRACVVNWVQEQREYVCGWIRTD